MLSLVEVGRGGSSTELVGEHVREGLCWAHHLERPGRRAISASGEAGCGVVWPWHMGFSRFRGRHTQPMFPGLRTRGQSPP